MLTAETARDLCRVRLLALRAMVAAGGRPRPSQLRRAVAPLVEAGLGDEELLPIGGSLAAAPAAAVDVVASRRVCSSGLGSTAAVAQCGSTVVSSSDAPPWL